MGRPVSPWSAALSAALLFLIWRFLVSIDASPVLIWLYAALVGLFALVTLRGLIAAFRWSRLLKAMREPTGLFGRTSFPTAEDAEDLGLSFSNEDGNGIPLGGVGDRIIYYKGPAPISIRAATNAGKTESSSALICFALGAHRNVIATAKGAELAWLCGRYRSKILRQLVVYIDPWRLMRKLGLPSHDFNPIGHLVDYAAGGSSELIDKARAAALILLPEPDSGGGGENKIFRVLARDLITWCIVYLALWQAETGELSSNLPYLFRKLSGSTSDVEAFFREMLLCDAYEGSVRRGAERFLSRMMKAEKFAESILSEAIAALDLYDPAGPLGHTTDYSDFDPKDLKNPDRPTTVFLIIPPEKTTLYGPHIGLCMNTLIDLCIEADRFLPQVTVVADEFASLGVMPSAVPALMMGRSRGVQLITYVQDTQSYARYAKEASAFTTQSEVLIAFSIRSTKDGEEYSKRSGQRSVVVESNSVPLQAGSPAGNHSLSLSEKNIPNLRPDEFLQLPDFTAAVFFKQHPPLIVDLVSFRAVAEWRQHAEPMPGAPPLKDLPVKYRA
ncbi:type IV secretory system conjugative DNA transfer family protein [Ancylobacter lacus]|uniref:type IV secretory system conjugative DNA transfer family protein n=1 Tax=Ancylobacter lacus TaxID=2579970 RepID=UPI001BCFD4CB|nr:type IV secretory system conjugative DNA transfer family protein [Ancylobacter lacus]MBS7537745.1 type IV secretory system conjugative DNA transfer family protein [Ancylobacter lacus]